MKRFYSQYYKKRQRRQKEWVNVEPTLHSNGRYYVTLVNNDGDETQRFVDELVLEAFVGPKPIGMEAIHINGDLKDSKLTNLRWGASE